MQSPHNHKLILVVEDDPTANGLVMDVLCDHDYRVIETSSVAVALRVAKKHKPQAVLLDLGMSDGAGVELLERLKSESHTSAIPVIVITNTNELLRQPAALQANARLPKAFSPASLLKVVETLTADDYVPLSATETEHRRVVMATTRRAVS